MKRALAAAVLLALPLFAAEKPFSLEDVMSAPHVSELVSAKAQLAWIANDRGARNVWVAEGPKYDARQVTKFSGDEGIDLGELTIAHGWVAFTRGGDLEIGAENPNPASFAATPEQHVFTVSIRDNVVHDIGEGHDPAISPNGDRVAFIAKKELMLAPLDGSAKPVALIAANGARNTLRWSPDGTKIAFVAHRKEHAFVGVIDMAGKAIRYLDPSVDADTSPV